MSEFEKEDVKRAYWINTHRTEIRTVGHGIAIGIVVIIWLILIINSVILIINYPSTKRAYTTIADTTINYSGITAPEDLTVKNSAIVDAGENHYDAYGEISNQNIHYSATFSYTVSVGGTTHRFTDGIIMPQQTLYVVDSGFNLTQPETTVSVKIEDVQWNAAPAQLPDIEFGIKNAKLYPVTLSEARAIENETSADTTNNTNNNTNTNKNFATPNTNNTNDQVSAAQYTALEATLINNNPLGFRRVETIIMLKDETDTIVGIHKRIIQNFDSFAEITTQVNWRRRFTIDVKPEIVLQTDYLDKDNLIYPGE